MMFTSDFFMIPAMIKMMVAISLNVTAASFMIPIIVMLMEDFPCGPESCENASDHGSLWDFLKLDDKLLSRNPLIGGGFLIQPH